MPRFSITMKKIKFKDKEFLKDTVDEIIDTFRWGMADFIIAALAEVHVDTGMSASSLVGFVTPFKGNATNAGKYFHITNNGINAARTNRGRKGNPPYYPTGSKSGGQDGYKTMGHGRELGEYTCYWLPRTMGINFETDVWQYKFWEDKKKEWESMRKGKAALKAYFDKEIKKLPNLKDYMVVYK